jgi:phage baseplate assembly protein W
MIRQRTTTLRVLGKGWPFPVRPESRSRRMEYVAGVEKVRQSIMAILETEPGERIMRPTFGCGLRRYLMKPNTTATRALIQHDVELALATWEPRIQVQAVDVAPGEDPSLVLIEIHYVHRHDAQSGNLVYPFYLE